MQKTKPNPLNPYHCGRPMRKSGKQKSGAQQYRCKCGFSYTDSDRPAYRLGEKLATAVASAERSKKYYLNNKEKCRQKSKEKSKKYYLENKEKEKERIKKYYLKHRKRYKALFKARYAKHKKVKE